LPINLEAVPGELSGKITRIAPSADLRSRVFEVEATIANPEGKLRAGMVASLKVPEAALAGAAQLSLPLTAVVRSPRDARGFSVFVVEGAEGKETARMRDVKLGDVLGNAVLVTEGLKAGDRAISMGATLVTDGQSVRVIP
jgi:multidrug efflux system membrane fusion protein